MQPTDLSSGIDSAMQAEAFPNFVDARNSLAPTPGQQGLPPKQPSGIGGFLERNAQTLGGILGGIGGEIIDPFGGGAAGSALLGGIGQEIKNKTTGTTTNPFEEGAIQGAGMLGGGLFGKGVAAIGKGAKSIAPDVFRSAFNLTPKVSKVLDSIGTSKKLTDLGYSGGLDKLSQQAGGDMSAIDNIYNQALQNSTGTIDTGKVMDAARNSLMSIDSVMQLNKKDVDQVLSQISKGDPENGLSPLTTDPLSAMDYMRNLDHIGWSIKNQIPDVGATESHLRAGARADAFIKAADEISDQLDNAVTPDALKSAMTDENLSKIGNKNMRDLVAGSESASEVRSNMSPLVRLRKMASASAANPRKSQLLPTAMTALLGNAAFGPAGAAGGMMLEPIVEGTENALRPGLNTLTAKGLNKLGNTLTSPGKTVAGNLSTRDIYKTLLTQDATSNAAGGQKAADTSPVGPVSSAISNSVNSMITPLINQKEGNSNQAPSFSDIMQAGGIQGLDAYLAYQKQETPQLSQDQQNEWLDNQKAVNELQLFAKNFEKVWAKGAGVGALQELGTKIPGIQNTGSEASLKAYNDERGDLAQALGKALGAGRITNATIDQMIAELPNVNDSPQAATLKLHNVVQALSMNMNAILSAPATNTPGQLLNFTNQTVPGTNNFNSLPSNPADVNFGSQ